ncbi:MAG: DnaB-like helicase C-terminal domain-containing protein, partial [Synergistaceae bacterium]|nr:DnaB-like helicase C-terminal domain-containing protein [Synergistaceae bacterium]
LDRAAQTLQRRNIFIYDSSELTAMDFRAKCRRFKTRHPDLSLVVVDYLQLMSSGSRRNDNRQYEVAEISRVMKSVAVELECPVIALSQLSRETERRTEKKPQLSDLRDSGAIEQDADTVIMLYREDYYSETENNDLQDSRADLRVAKNRNGTTGLCHLTFQRKYTRFMNYGG